MQKLTPAMQQYMDIKNKHPDCLILFRMGDFYETFFEDAKTASKALEIALTSRGHVNGTKIPLAGIPYHALDGYLSKLVKRGFRVAIVEQLEDPKQAKGVVKRDVVRIVTPGTVIEPHILDEKTNNYIASVYFDNRFGISIVDLTTGEFISTEADDLQILSRFQASEILVPYTQKGFTKKHLKETTFINEYEDRFFLSSLAVKKLTDHFQTQSMDGFGFKGRDLALSSAGALLNYLSDTQKSKLNHIKNINMYHSTDYMLIDDVTIRNLELISNIRDRSINNTLLHVLDNTKTPMGARMIRKWIIAPLRDQKQINDRHTAVQELCATIIIKQDLNKGLKSITDIERLISRINLGNASPRDLVALKNSLSKTKSVQNILSGAKSESLVQCSKFPDLSIVIKLIDKAIKDEPALLTREGNIIKTGYNPKLDEIRSIITNSKSYIRDLEKKERTRTQIKNLKIRFNRVFGYFFEVTKRNLDLVPDDYIRKQTMANCERFITEELKDLEEKVLTSEEKVYALEQELFSDVLASVSKETEYIQDTAKKLAVIDCINSLAAAAVDNNYTKPIITQDFDIHLSQSRHPIVEKLEESFIPNDINLNTDQSLLVITGPNMAGKSTVMRQVALICIMAQIGSFVPCKKAKIGIIDRIFSRVGAHDDITHGQSTFMVEMNEVASILNNATNQSLIIMDEIGRGTSTFDGVSIAWAVAEHISKNLKCKTMFATHYHVLTKLSEINGVENYNIAVQEDQDEITFLRKLIKGGTDKSYGIHVAKLSGMPKSVITKAREIQKSLEQNDNMHQEITINADNSVKETGKPEQKTLSQFERF